jgi:hypothetical protein
MKSMSTGIVAGLALVFIAFTSVARAQAPFGHYHYEFTTNDGPALWNFSGVYATPYYITNTGLRVSHTARGGVEAYYESAGLASGAVVGTIQGSGANLKARLVSRMWIPTGAPDNVMRRTDRLSLVFDASGRTLIGTDQAQSAYQVLVGDGFPYNHWETLNRMSFRQPVTLEVPDSTDGNWTLDLEIVPNGNKLVGTAELGFANGVVFDFDLLGRYEPGLQRTKVVLKGIGTSKGASLSIRMSGPLLGIERMSGRVAGQSVKLL